MNKLNFLQPDKNNLNTYLYTGVILVAFSIFIVFLNSDLLVISILFCEVVSFEIDSSGPRALIKELS